MNEPSSIMIVSDSLQTLDGLMFDGYDMSDSPIFSKKDISEFFFGFTVHYMRKIEQMESVLTLNGEEVGNVRDHNNRRVYNLAEVEKVAYALFEHKLIKLRRFRLALAALQIEAQIHDIFAGEISVPHV